MKKLLSLAALCIATLGMACTAQYEADHAPAPTDPGAAIERDGVIYTPMSVGPEGCLLYNVRIPGGSAPAAMVYQTVDGAFTYGRPDNCIKVAGAQ